MELRQLNTFMAIAEHGSFSKAAQELGYAQSTITSQIQVLEAELNVRLFERLGHNIALTHEGRKLLPISEQILRLSKEAKTILSHQSEPSGSLSIGAVESLCVTKLPKLLAEYRSRYPAVELLIKFGTSDEFMGALKSNAIDIAFFVDQVITNDDFIKMMESLEPMALICTPEHSLAGRDKVYPQDLSGEPLILTESCCGYRKHFDSILSQFNIKPRSVIETGNVQAIKQLILSGMGITFLPQTAVEEELQQKRLVRLSWEGPEFRIFTQVMYHRTKWMSAALKAFIDLIHEMN